mmetsp:Transcript_9597/g.33141  ORF Transcript_9597/g.33141 Transcript_9597/m.33141 type:complete len:354 (+) Transcript_9597:49-1110(+)
MRALLRARVLCVCLFSAAGLVHVRHTATRPVALGGTRPRNCYDYRRLNDGIYIAARSLALGGTRNYYDYRRLNDGMLEDEGALDATAVPPAVLPTAVKAQKPPPSAQGQAGQSHYHNLHVGEIEAGVRSHLLELGLGSEMELGFECGNFDDTDDSAAVECVESGEVRCPPLKSTAEWRALEQHTKQLEQTHLRTLLDDSQRCASLNLEVNLKSAAGAQVGPVVLDWARQKVTPETMGLLFQLARKMGVERKIERMRRGERVNLSERRAVLHMAVRAPRSKIKQLDGEFAQDPASATAVPLRDAIAASSNVRERIWDFADAVRSGRVCNLDGEPFKHIVVVGIGGAYLGPEVFF